MITQTTVSDTVAAIALAADSDYKQRMFYPQDMQPGTASAKHGFAEGFDTKSMKFTVHLNSKPSEALAKFFHGTGHVVCECHAFVMAVYFYTVRELLGAEIFDKEFADMDIASKLSPQSCLYKVLRERRFDGLEASVLKGDWIYISNVPAYKERHPFGNAPGWNLICVSDETPKRYVGFGLSETSAQTQGKTLDEIKDILTEEYEKKPTTSGLLSMGAVASTRGRSGSVGSSTSTTSSVKRTDELEYAESGAKMIRALKEEQAKKMQIKTDEPYFEPDSKRWRISAEKLNQLKGAEL